MCNLPKSNGPSKGKHVHVFWLFASISTATALQLQHKNSYMFHMSPFSMMLHHDPKGLLDGVGRRATAAWWQPEKNTTVTAGKTVASLLFLPFFLYASRLENDFPISPLWMGQQNWERPFQVKSPRQILFWNFFIPFQIFFPLCQITLKARNNIFHKPNSIALIF